jgi:hypothetical protein
MLRGPRHYEHGESSAVRTFACGLPIAVAHVLKRRFVAPVYDVLANLAAFGCAVGASSLLGHPIRATLSAAAILSWLVLARRRILDRRPQVRAGVGRPEHRRIRLQASPDHSPGNRRYALVATKRGTVDLSRRLGTALVRSGRVQMSRSGACGRLWMGGDCRRVPGSE